MRQEQGRDRAAGIGGAHVPLNLAGNQVPRTSKLAGNLGVAFDGDLSDTLGWFARADSRFESKQYVLPDNLATTAERVVVNLRAGVKTDRYRFTAFVDNLTNNQTPENVLKLTRLNDFQGNLSGYLPLPRMYGVTVAADF
ncbi:TonB-dependent receptor [Novosphingobium sp. CECT 9465]|uniref:TonB-dependent receptor n=1 Tax=Novosphingobium sp. CECT 9465 TaxID=2829794 RepID=UPI001F8DE60F|nr:TonB-dependent receptor [Novosphingobium sp. CECT 9465]CAH0495270.1 hypothetical protein NVSP9465_00276 [Novosphingobium sp. CECT 9465]